MERVDDGGGSVVITRRWSGERLDRREREGSLALLSDCSVGAGRGRRAYLRVRKAKETLNARPAGGRPAGQGRGRYRFVLFASGIITLTPHL